MDKKMMYSVLRYSPYKTSGESINLGVLYSVENGKKVVFKRTRKMKRLKEFDERLYADVVNSLLDSISKEAKKLSEEGKFDIYSFTKFYINNYHFDSPQNTSYTNYKTKIDEINRRFLRYDYMKENESKHRTRVRESREKRHIGRAEVKAMR